MTDTEGEGCGIKPFMTKKTDPFYTACAWHDSAYLENSWHELNIKRALVDKTFYEQMLQIAGENKFLKLKAWLYYRLARLFGARFWDGSK